jgi:hypothetical protein
MDPVVQVGNADPILAQQRSGGGENGKWKMENGALYVLDSAVK